MVAEAVSRWVGGLFQREYGAEEGVLDHGELAQHLRLVHLDQSWKHVGKISVVDLDTRFLPALSTVNHNQIRKIV